MVRTNGGEPFMLNSTYKVTRKIGSGSFGEIYVAINVNTGEQFAVKLENSSTTNPQLKYESKVYKIVQDGFGVPNIHWFGCAHGYNALVMDLLGPSLEKVFNFCQRKFSLKTVLMLADQMLARIEYLHEKNFIHRDIKPDNFLMGAGKNQCHLFIVDFGLSKRFRDPRTKAHIPYKRGNHVNGTVRYASINNHLGIEQSRRDDMESIAHVLMYFNTGKLPWQGLPATTKKQKYERICEMKMNVPIAELCRNFPPEFSEYLSYSRHLKYDETPDYMFFRQSFRNRLRALNFEFDLAYDWMKPMQVPLPLPRCQENIRYIVAAPDWGSSNNPIQIE